MLAFVGSNTLVMIEVGLGILAALLLAIVFYALIRRQRAGDDKGHNDGSVKGRFRAAIEAGRHAYREFEDERLNKLWSHWAKWIVTIDQS